MKNIAVIGFNNTGKTTFSFHLANFFSALNKNVLFNDCDGDTTQFNNLILPFQINNTSSSNSFDIRISEAYSHADKFFFKGKDTVFVLYTPSINIVHFYMWMQSINAYIQNKDVYYIVNKYNKGNIVISFDRNIPKYKIPFDNKLNLSIYQSAELTDILSKNYCRTIIRNIIDKIYLEN